MADLVERLKAALADRYRIERGWVPGDGDRYDIPWRPRLCLSA